MYCIGQTLWMQIRRKTERRYRSPPAAATHGSDLILAINVCQYLMSAAEIDSAGGQHQQLVASRQANAGLEPTGLNPTG